MFNMTLLYMNRNIPLQAKILFGYMMLMAVIIMYCTPKVGHFWGVFYEI